MNSNNLTSLYSKTSWFEPVANPENRFSLGEAHLRYNMLFVLFIAIHGCIELKLCCFHAKTMQQHYLPADVNDDILMA